MSSSPCLRCLARPELRSVRRAGSHGVRKLAVAFAAFSTSSPVQNPAAKPPPRGKRPVMMTRKVQAFGGKKRKDGGQAKNAKNTPNQGERKAMRHRIVLSNTSALEVPGLEEMSKENIVDESSIGTVLAIPGPIVDQLRAAQAFKKTQSWKLFRKPSMLIRKETVELARELEALGKKTLRRVYIGDRGSGKSMILLQAQAIALQKGWIVVNIPEAQYVTDGSSDYKPIPNTKPLMFDQAQYAMELLRRVIATNPSLKTFKVKLQHRLPTALPANASLFDLCDLGVEDTAISSVVLSAFLKELEGADGPPALFALDGLAYAMRDSEYKTQSYEPIHAHRLAIVDWFMSYLSGEKKLPNGGAVLAAPSASNDPRNETLEFRLYQLYIKQALEQGLPNPARNAALPDPVLPFLLATGQQPNPVPQPDPYFKYDEEVFKVLGSPFGVVAGNKTADANEVNVQTLKGMSKEEARGLMEYWAKSGIMKREVNERLLGERWTLSGGGVVGELEKGCIRSRIH